MTRWGREVDPDRVLPDYPRPQLRRDSYLSLNGYWDYAVTGLDVPEPTTYDGRVLVPFSPEAPLSGVGRQTRPDELLWYHRDLVLPEGFAVAGGRLLLHFGAVDQTCTVWVDGVDVGSHHGGYLPFTLDVTEVVSTGSTTPDGASNTRNGRSARLVVRVRDLSNNRGPSSGKQRLARGGIWYTAQSGIWQTVWLEAVPATYVASLVLTPVLDEGAVEVVVSTGSTTRDAGSTSPARVRVLDGGREVGAAEVVPGLTTRIHLSDVHPWTPEDPHLYDVEVVFGDDRVTSFFGMRSFGVGPGADGLPRLLLNGEPYLHVGVLDQGYWPDGLMTAPSDAAMVHDIATMKRLGFTMLRKHLKVEPLRWYAHCDRLGMLVWQDLVNGGERYRTAAVTWPGRWPVRLRDDRYALLGRADPAGRDEFRAELRATVEHLRSVTSLAVWVPFNEGWGQFDAADVARELSALDPTRSVDHASGWHDQGAGDLWSLHVYQRRFRVPRRDPDERRVLVLSEYGGYDLTVPGHTWGPEHFGYRHFESAASLGEAFARLHDEEVAPAVRRGLAGTVYTQLSDVEDEANGLLTYDREVLKLPEELVRRTVAALYAGARTVTQ